MPVYRNDRGDDGGTDNNRNGAKQIKDIRTNRTAIFIPVLHIVNAAALI